MGNKARRIRSGKFAKKFATLREKASARLGLTKVETKEEEALVTEPAPVATPAPVAPEEVAETAPAKKKSVKKKKKAAPDA